MSTETGKARQKYFHSTKASSAEAILASGFRDVEGFYLTSMRMRGVFLSERPFDQGEGAAGDALLEISMPGNIDLSDYELVEELKPAREWCVPAEIINEHADVRWLDDEQADEIRYLLRIPDKWPDCPDCGEVLQLVDEETFDTDVQIGQCPQCGFQSLRRTR